MCLEVKYRSENVISARIGRLSRNQNEACDTELFFDKSIQSTTLISKLSNIFYQAQHIKNIIYYDKSYQQQNMKNGLHLHLDIGTDCIKAIAHYFYAVK